MKENKSNKGKWFATKNHDAIIQCTEDNFIDFLSLLFKNDYEKAERISKEFHPVTEEEYYEYRLYENNNL